MSLEQQRPRGARIVEAPSKDAVEGADVPVEMIDSSREIIDLPADGLLQFLAGTFSKFPKGFYNYLVVQGNGQEGSTRIVPILHGKGKQYLAKPAEKAGNPARPRCLAVCVSEGLLTKGISIIANKLLPRKMSNHSRQFVPEIDECALTFDIKLEGSELKAIGLHTGDGSNPALYLIMCSEETDSGTRLESSCLLQVLLGAKQLPLDFLYTGDINALSLQSAQLDSDNRTELGEAERQILFKDGSAPQLSVDILVRRLILEQTKLELGLDLLPLQLDPRQIAFINNGCVLLSPESAGVTKIGEGTKVNVTVIEGFNSTSGTLSFSRLEITVTEIHYRGSFCEAKGHVRRIAVRNDASGGGTKVNHDCLKENRQLLSLGDSRISEFENLLNYPLQFAALVFQGFDWI